MSSGKRGFRLRSWGWITVSQIALGPRDGQKPLVLQWQLRALGNTNILPWWVQRGLCVALCAIHSLFSLAIYFFPWLPFLHVEDADFPLPTTPSYSLLSSLLSEPLCLSRHADDSGQFWGREAGECLCCTHVEQDLQQDKCQICYKQVQRLREDIVLQGAGVICSAASCWSDTLQR